jgi:hypothetical protein
MVICHLQPENLMHISSNRQHGFFWASYCMDNFFCNMGISTAERAVYWVLYTNATVSKFCIRLDILCKHNAGIMNDSGTTSHIVARDTAVSVVTRLWAV